MRIGWSAPSPLRRSLFTAVVPDEQVVERFPRVYDNVAEPDEGAGPVGDEPSRLL